MDVINEEILKVVILGDEKTGKTYLLNNLISEKEIIKEEIQSTDTYEIKLKSINLENKKIIFQLSDSPGKKKYKSILNSYIKDNDIIILIYEPNKRETFNSINSIYLPIIKEEKSESLLILISNLKYNNDIEKEVLNEEAIKFSEENSMKFYEINSSNKENLNILFIQIANDYFIYKENKEKEKQIKLKEKKMNLHFGFFQDKYSVKNKKNLIGKDSIFGEEKIILLKNVKFKITLSEIDYIFCGFGELDLSDYDGVFFLFDYKNYKSLEEIEKYLFNIKRNRNKVLVIGNKDQEKKNKNNIKNNIKKEDAEKLCKKYNIKFMEISFEKKKNINEIFHCLLNNCINVFESPKAKTKKSDKYENCFIF